MSFRIRPLALAFRLVLLTASAAWLSARWANGQEPPKPAPPAKQPAKESKQPGSEGGVKEPSAKEPDPKTPNEKQPDPKKEDPKKEAEKNLRYYQREPHDELRLRESKGKDGKDKEAVVLVRPLELPNDELPKNPTTRVPVIVLDLPPEENKYEVQRGRIIAWTRFRELILREAERQVDDGHFDEAFFYYEFLRKYYQGRLPTLDASTARFHLEEAKTYLPAKDRHAQALALLNLAFELHAATPGLGDAMSAAVQGLMDGYIGQRKFTSARLLLAGFQQKFPQHPAAAKWQERLSGEAQKLFAEAKVKVQASQLHEARELALRSVHIWPLDEARLLLDDAQRRSPRLVVGVTLAASRMDPRRLDDWAALRSGRLLHRTLVEFTGHGALGGQYRCPLGAEPRHEALGRQWVLELNPKIAWSDGRGALTAADVCRHLMAMANPKDDLAYRADWADLFSSARVRNGVEVVVDLRRAHVHPDGLLQTVVPPWYQRAAGVRPATLGPFVVHQATADEVRYRANEHYFAAGVSQPKEIIERRFADGRLAVSALRGGDIGALDRVNPWDVEKLQAVPYLAVQPYAVPTVHALIPHPDHKLLARRTFRRCLESAIHRQRILDELLKGSQQPGNQLVSGPFPSGVNENDSRGYAYDRTIAPRPYDRALAVTLLNLAVAQENAARKKRDEEPLNAAPPMVLLHPPHDSARVACREIKRQLQLLGLMVNLKEQASPSDAYDLRYAELAVWEPLVDAHRLLGPGGVVGRTSSYMSLALRELAQAEDWGAVLHKLKEIHRLAHEELPLIPLWQLTDYFAHHRDLKGIGGSCASLYQDVEQWQSPPAILRTTP